MKTTLQVPRIWRSVLLCARLSHLAAHALTQVRHGGCERRIHVDAELVGEHEHAPEDIREFVTQGLRQVIRAGTNALLGADELRQVPDVPDEPDHQVVDGPLAAVAQLLQLPVLLTNFQCLTGRFGHVHGFSVGTRTLRSVREDRIQQKRHSTAWAIYGGLNNINIASSLMSYTEGHGSVTRQILEVFYTDLLNIINNGVAYLGVEKRSS